MLLDLNRIRIDPRTNLDAKPNLNENPALDLSTDLRNEHVLCPKYIKLEELHLLCFNKTLTIQPPKNFNIPFFNSTVAYFS